VRVISKDTRREVAIRTGKARELLFWEGPLVVNIGSNTWLYPEDWLVEHPEARKRHFPLGVCQALVSDISCILQRATLEPDWSP